MSVPDKRTRRRISDHRETFWRTLQTFGLTRILITLVLLGYAGMQTGKGGSSAIANWGTLYLVLAAGFALASVYLRRYFRLQLLAQVSFDIAAISVLYLSAGGASSGLAILYLFPLSGCAILAPLMLALFAVSVVTLIMLGESGYQLLRGVTDASTAHAGLYGAAFFAAVYTLNRFAATLIKQEELAARRGRELRMQEAINRLVIAHMDDGILVVGPDTEVFAANPAAERMLGWAMPVGPLHYHLSDIPSLAPIAEAFAAWVARGSSASSTFVKVKPGPGVTTQGVSQDISIGPDGRRELVVHLKLRFAAVGNARGRTVIFLQDVTEIENRAQQLKLASMGRLTASIAHEVRNPLSAIAHAASLLDEELTGAAHRRLLKIVNDNVLRLNRMVEDILKLSRKAHVEHQALALRPFLEDVVNELRENHGLNPRLIAMRCANTHQVRFDPLHLREVVINLLSNALRYASGNEGSIRLEAIAPAPDCLELHIQDDGQAISQEVRSHLFEPFYTTSSKGTGLGLYVARELCLNNGAKLDYEYRMEQSADGVNEPSGRFVITFAASSHH